MAQQKNETIYQLNVALQESSPLIWRRIQAFSRMTLPHLHRTLQIVMGWENYHLHEFRVAGKVYAEPDPEDHHFGPDIADERRARLGKLLFTVGSTLEYVYDLGDNWRHEITLESILPITPRKRYPVCLAGARNAPPEDVGGIGGYERYVEALFDPQHGDHKTLLNWRGQFDPEHFSITSVNRRLREEFPLPPRPNTRSPIVRSPKASSRPSSSVMDFEFIVHSAIRSGRLPHQERIQIGPEDPIPLSLSARDRELIVEHSFADADLTERLRFNSEYGKSQIAYFTFEELDNLIGYVAAESNHAERKMQKEWDLLYDRIAVAMSGMKIRSNSLLQKKARRGFRGYPVATVAFYGPTGERASKVAVAILPRENAEPLALERWFSEERDMRSDPAITRQILAFIQQHDAKSVAMTNHILGCPHEEGIDYPDGQVCPHCPFWTDRDRWAF